MDTTELEGDHTLPSITEDQDWDQNIETKSDSTHPEELTEDYSWAIPLIKAMERDDWTSFQTQFKLNTSAGTMAINSRGKTFLHLATETGNVYFVRELVNLMLPADLELMDKSGYQALIYAATGGINEIAEIMLEKNGRLVSIPCHHGLLGHGLLPVVVAAKNGNKDMAHYLYSKTPLEELKTINGARLVIAAVVSDMYDIALDLLHHHPKLAIACDSHERNAATVLAEKPFAFPSGCQHGILERAIYRGIPVLSSTKYLEREIDCYRDGITTRIRTTNLVFYSLRRFIWRAIKCISVPCFRIKEIHAKKLMHLKSFQVLRVIADQLSSLNESQLLESRAYVAINEASKFGIVEMVSELIKCNPDLQFSTDREGRDIFQVATKHRQEKVFNLLYEMRNKKMIAVRGDKLHNNLLHIAGTETPSSQLDKISGAALQMQRELQWFKEVEKLVPPRFVREVNDDGETPRELFTKNHKEMVKAGEAWMKGTSQACMVVATLIATVMFTAAFTVPGGNKSDTGTPVFIKSEAFLIFIVTDALSLFSSCTSMLMFLAILTSRYAEQDFLLTLPRKLILGLTTLFFSVASMMAAFCATLFIVLEDRSIWLPILSTLIATVPVSLFVMLQFPLLVDMVYATYGPTIFGRKIIGIYF